MAESEVLRHVQASRSARENNVNAKGIALARDGLVSTSDHLNLHDNKQ
jgi:hypothetical protein